MANRFFNPNEQFCDATGLPYAGGSLAFFASGTSTPLNTYSDSALSIPNINPVVLDSAGRANAIFLQNLAYKVVLSDVNNNQIWTEDPVYTSDYSTRAKLTSGSGSPNGVVAGTAGSAGIGADTYWDNVNNILYVCTTTGSASTAVWTTVNSTAAAAITPPPQGYLTPTSGTPVITSDVTNATSFVYTPYVGNLVPIYNGTGFTPTVFSELTLNLTSSQAASTIYDVFIFNNSGVLTLVTGPAWTNSTAGSCARGAGGGTTQLSRLSGIWVNTVQISGKNGSTTYTIPANQATYLGSIYIDTSAGNITCTVGYGQNRKWSIWNAYNRVNLRLNCNDVTTGASYTTNAWRVYRGGTTGSAAIVFQGLAEEQYTAVSYVSMNAVSIGNGQNTTYNSSIGLNSTTVPNGNNGFFAFTNSIGGTSTVVPGGQVIASLNTQPLLGVNVFSPLENGSGCTTNLYGPLTLTCQWRG